MPDKIINVLPPISPVPEEGQEKYLMPVIKKEGDTPPTGGHFTLADVYKPVKANADAIKAQNDRITDLEHKPTVDAYTREETNNLLDEKVDKTAQTIVDNTQNERLTALENRPAVDAYTKVETDALLLDKAPVIHDVKTGEVVVAPTMEAPLDSLTIFGKTEQKTTEGKNLFNVDFLESELDKSHTYEGVWILPVDVPSNVSITLSVEKNMGSQPDNLFLAVCTQPALKGERWFIHPSVYTYQTVTYQNVEIQNSKIYVIFNASISQVDTVRNLIRNSFQIETGNSRTTFEPYTGGKPSPSPDYPQPIITSGASSSIETKVRGKNLLDKTKFQRGEFIEFNGVPCYKYKDDVFNFTYADSFFEKTQYAFTFRGFRENTSHYIGIRFIYSDGYEEEIQVNPNEIKTKISLANKTLAKIKGSNAWGEVAYIDLTETQIEVGSVATPYEPYKPLQTLVSATSNGLNGIGGVYDEKNYETGKQTKRFGVYVFDGSSDENWKVEKVTGGIYYRFTIATPSLKKSVSVPAIANIRCNAYQPRSTGDTYSKKEGISIGAEIARIEIYDESFKANDLVGFKASLASHPITVIAELAEPIITDIPQEEMDAYHALHSNNPTTTVWNDASSPIELGFRADTKGWILEQIQNALGQATAQTMALTRSLPVATQRGIVDKAIAE